MLLSKRVGSGDVLRMGMVALLAAFLARWAVSRSSLAGSGGADAVVGFLFGISIALLLLSVWMRSRRPGPTP